MNKSSIFLKILALAALLGACEGSKVEKNSIELDPQVAAEVKKINMQRYAGFWLVPGTKGSMYLEVRDDGYFVMLEDKEGRILKSDFGTLDHYKPGLMILKTERAECETDGIVFLKMDQHEGAVRLRSVEDRNLYLQLQAVEPREHLRNSTAACVDF